jgi:hypothetical protein
MAKVPKRSTTADSEPLQSTEWMPLTEAYRHIQKVVGGWQLAAEDLRQRLVSGDVEAQDRLVTRGEGIGIIALTPEDWKGRAANADAHGLWFSGFFPLHGHNIFLRPADVYRIWPIAGDAWMPLTEAFRHMQQVVGGWQLAAEDLRQRLVSGDVEAQDRLVTRGEGIGIIALTPADWKGRVAHADAHGMSFSGFSPLPGHNIFLHRADVYHIWPTAAEKPQAALPTTRPKGLGPKAWLAAREIYALRREGGKWINLDELLSQIRTRLGGNEWASKGTVKTALAYLRRQSFIDL